MNTPVVMVLSVSLGGGGGVVGVEVGELLVAAGTAGVDDGLSL